MKQYIYIIMLMFLGTSCSKDFLKEDPKGSVLDPNIFFSSDQIQLAGDNLPRYFRNIYGQSGCVSPFMGGDDLTSRAGFNKQKFIEGDVFAVTDENDRIFLYWQNCYSVVRAANSILDNVDKSFAGVPLKNDVKGQAYFYRGLAYSFLTRIFGKVPLITKFAVNPDLTVGKAEVSEIYKQITSDLIAAENLLPNVRPETPDQRGGYPGAKPCKGTAKTVLAQVYLTMAGWPLKEVSNYALAATKAKEVIDNQTTYGYQILPNPKDLWTWANNYTNKEIVLGMYFSSTEQSMHGPLGSRPEEDFLGGWASGWYDYAAEISFFKRFPAGPRKDATFRTLIGGMQWDDPRATKHKHPYYNKYEDEEPNATWIGQRCAQVIRFADVILIYAEAKAMSTGADQSAYDAINIIRKRAGLPNLTSGLSATAFRDSVVAERGWEFAGGEASSRWFDLIRTETVEAMTLLRDPVEIPLAKQPTHSDYWMPIPGIDVGVDPNLK